MIGKILLAVVLLCMPFVYMEDVYGDDQTVELDEEMNAVIQKYDLDDTTFSVAYYDTVTGESYDWNGTTYMFAASTYKLALNMYYYLQEEAGNIDPHAYIGGYDLADAHYLSIVQSDNDASEALIYGLGTYRDYQNDMFSTFGDAYYRDLNNIEEIAYYDNHYPADFMMDVLQYLYAYRDSFTELLGYMSDPDQRNGFDNTISEKCTVYQKQGWYETTNAVLEIVDSDEPYLAVIMVDDTKHGNGAAVCTEVNELLYAYNDTAAQFRAYLEAKAEQEAEDQISEEYEVGETAVQIEEEEEEENSDRILYVLFAIIAVSVPVSGLTTVLRQ